MKKVIFHIGFSKTGTTAIQSFLKSNQNSLKSKGILYPENFSHEGSSCHHKLYWLLPPFISPGNPNAVHINETETFEENLIKFQEELEGSGCDTAIFSSELFTNNELQEKLNNLKQLFDGYDLNYVFYIRKQDEYIKSIYNQLVKNNVFTRSFKDFLKHSKGMVQNTDYYNFVGTISEMFSKDKIIVRRFGKEFFTDNNIFSDFFGSIDIKLDDTFNVPAKGTNPGFPNELLNLMRSVNMLQIPVFEKQKIKDKLSKIQLPEKMIERNRRNVFIVNDEEFKNLISCWNKSNNKLHSEFFKNDTPPLFTKDISADEFPTKRDTSINIEISEVLEHAPKETLSSILTPLFTSLLQDN